MGSDWMLKHIEYVYAVYSEKSFTRAAEKLYISQPSLSSTIKKLEKELGFPIFERCTKEIKPTYLGEKYIRAIEEILLIKNNLENEIDDLLKLRKGSINLGSTSFIVSNLLPDLLKEFCKKYPAIKINITVEQSTVLLDKLEKGQIDILIDNATTLNSDICYIPLLSEHILLAVPNDFEINNLYKDYQISANEITKNFDGYDTLPKIDILSFKDEEFILLNTGNKMRQIAKKIFAQKGITPKISFEFDNLATAISYAEKGFGICFLTDTVIKYANTYKNLTFYQPNTEFADRTLYIMHKKSRYLSSAGNEFISFLKEKRTD